MQNNLVIVESPAKAKTIEKFLGKDYKVLSSYGHIRDLKKKNFSIDVDNNFKPIYEVPEDKKKVVSQLKSEAKKADVVWLASDEDREGEAIAWHLYEVLDLKKKDSKRIVFHEITEKAILNAIENPRNIDINLVDAQQARRVLDRIVGFELSPVLWKKVKPSLSAGRVQSVTVRLIVEREREIQNFNQEKSYRVTAEFNVDDKGKNVVLKAELNKRFATKEEAEAFMNDAAKAVFKIDNINTRPVKKSPAAPFTTSTLQQEAARKLGFTVSQTMMVAQRLYESGKITYMRTDSVNLSTFAIEGCKTTIENTMGKEYFKKRNFATKSKGAQEAHEAIRPTHIEDAKIEGTAQEKRLYDLIWKRTLASQMSEAVLEKTTISIDMDNRQEMFNANGEVVKFDGFLKVYRESYDDEEITEEVEGLLPALKVGEVMNYGEIKATERFTQHPPRYTEASLVKKLEELGIGRPSTYAPTISTIQNRDYVLKTDIEGNEREYDVISLKSGKLSEKKKKEISGAEKGKLIPTDIGIVVNDFLTEYFPEVMNYNFTASVEKDFDNIAEGELKWTDVMHSFYKQFHDEVTKTLEAKTDHKAGERILGIDPKTNRQVSAKIGRYGPVVQIGTVDEEEKPKFSQLRKGQSLETITLEEALDLFKLPRELGEHEGKIVKIGVGRFGPYIYHNAKYTSLPKTADPMTISLDEAVELIKEKLETEKKRHIKKFDEEPELEVMNGRYGAYIAYKGKNYKIPKDIIPEDLTLQCCLDLVKIQDEKGTAKPKRKYAKKTK